MLCSTFGIAEDRGPVAAAAPVTKARGPEVRLNESAT
jgi:hypothetical protein